MAEGIRSLGLAVVVAIGLTASASAAGDAFLDRIDFSPKHAKAWSLPRKLAEISGMASTADGRVFTHDDESGIVYEIDPNEGKVKKAFALGKPTVKEDFEGIALADGKVYLVTSSGVIYEAPEGADGTRVLYNTYGTGIGQHCEVEGLAYDPRADDLLIPCKTPYDKAFEDHFVLYRWNVTRKAPPEGPALDVPLSDVFSGVDGPKHFRPSGIEIVPESGNYLIVASLNHLVVEMTPEGLARAIEKLDKGDHPQAEGVTILPGPVLLISDEGSKRHGRLALYGRKENR